MNLSLPLLCTLAACGKQALAPEPIASTPVPITKTPAATKSDGAPATIDAKVSDTATTLTVAFTGAASDASIQAWGATGLQLPKAELWTGAVDAGDVRALRVEHEGVGDLAVQITGTFAGQAATMVRSFTVGNGRPTPVPQTTIDGTGVKGWEVTPE